MPFNEQAKFLCYHGEILVFQLSRGERADLEMPTDPLVLGVKRMMFDRETSTFLLISTVFLNINEKDSHLKILCCNCVSDLRTRINLPCVLIQCRKYNSEAFKYCILLLHNLNRVERLLSFELNHALDENTKIFDGPIVFWQYLNQFFYISSAIGKVTTISLMLSSIEWIGEIENFGLGFLGLAEPSEDKCTQKLSESDYEFSNSSLCAYALKSQEMLSNGYLIPLAYSTMVTHVHVWAAEMVDHQLRTSLIALTRKNQLILFQNGIPVRACQLPFPGPRSVQILDAGKRNRFFIVSFPSKACAVSEKKFKVVAKWEQLSLVLVNDFAGVGTEQVLVVFEDSLDADQLTSFTVTDFVKIWYSNSFIFLNKIQQHISFKDKFIAKSWKALLNAVYGKGDSLPSDEMVKLDQKGVVYGSQGQHASSSHEATKLMGLIYISDGLVPFCDEGEDSVPTPEENLPDNFPEPEHIVEQTWCHVLDDDLVVGAKVTSLKESQGVLFQCLDHLIKVLPEICSFKYLKVENEDFLVDHLSSTLEAELVTFCSVSTSAFEYVRGGYNCRIRRTDNRAMTFLGRRAKIRQSKRKVQRERILKHLNMTVNGSSYAEMTLALAEIQLKSDLIVKTLANFVIAL
ncbi:Fanconi anemia, complementation group B [Mus musculus]|nr:Fanconi anemia, complementation group B [Mus musculus]